MRLLNRGRSIRTHGEMCFSRRLAVSANYLIFDFEGVWNGYPLGNALPTSFGRVKTRRFQSLYGGSGTPKSNGVLLDRNVFDLPIRVNGSFQNNLSLLPCALRLARVFRLSSIAETGRS